MTYRWTSIEISGCVLAAGAGDNELSAGNNVDNSWVNDSGAKDGEPSADKSGDPRAGDPPWIPWNKVVIGVACTVPKVRQIAVKVTNRVKNWFILTGWLVGWLWSKYLFSQ